MPKFILPAEITCGEKECYPCRWESDSEFFCRYFNKQTKQNADNLAERLTVCLALAQPISKEE